MTTQNWQNETATEVLPATGPMVGSGESTPARAKGEATEVAREGADAAKHVARSAASEAQQVAQEAGVQGRKLVGELGSDLKTQADTQQQKLAEGLRSISDDLHTMLQGSQSSGTVSAALGQAAQRSGTAADWLGSREPLDLLKDVESFARRRPGLFLAIAAGAGLMAGRLARGLAAGTSGGAATSGSRPRTATSAPSPREVQNPASDSAAYAFTDPFAGEPVIEPGTPPHSTDPEGRMPL